MDDDNVFLLAGSCINNKTASQGAHEEKRVDEKNKGEESIVPPLETAADVRRRVNRVTRGMSDFNQNQKSDGSCSSVERIQRQRTPFCLFPHEFADQCDAKAGAAGPRTNPVLIGLGKGRVLISFCLERSQCQKYFGVFLT